MSIRANTNLIEITSQDNSLVSVEADNGYNHAISVLDLRNNDALTCILVDDITAAQGYVGWTKDAQAHYKLECDDDDNDGVADIGDVCPTTPFGDTVDLFGCSVFSLPFKNLTILTTSETLQPRYYSSLVVGKILRKSSWSKASYLKS